MIIKTTLPSSKMGLGLCDGWVWGVDVLQGEAQSVEYAELNTDSAMIGWVYLIERNGH